MLSYGFSGASVSLQLLTSCFHLVGSCFISSWGLLPRARFCRSWTSILSLLSRRFTTLSKGGMYQDVVDPTVQVLFYHHYLMSLIPFDSTMFWRSCPISRSVLVFSRSGKSPPIFVPHLTTCRPLLLVLVSQRVCRALTPAMIKAALFYLKVCTRSSIPSSSPL